MAILPSYLNSSEGENADNEWQRWYLTGHRIDESRSERAMQASSFLEGGFSQVVYEATGGRAMAGLLRGPRGHPGVG